MRSASEVSTQHVIVEQAVLDQLPDSLLGFPASKSLAFHLPPCALLHVGSLRRFLFPIKLPSLLHVPGTELTFYCALLPAHMQAMTLQLPPSTTQQTTAPRPATATPSKTVRRRQLHPATSLNACFATLPCLPCMQPQLYLSCAPAQLTCHGASIAIPAAVSRAPIHKAVDYLNGSRYHPLRPSNCPCVHLSPHVCKDRAVDRIERTCRV